MDILREHYNGYLFHEDAKNKVYNSSLLMYFIKGYVINGKSPKTLIDSNVISDYTKMIRLFDLYENTVEKKEMIESIVGGIELTGIIKNRIGPLVKNVSDIGTESQLGFTRDDFISLLYYLGLLTVAKPAGNHVSLIAPNYCISSVYSEYYLSYLYDQMNIAGRMSEEVGFAMYDVILKKGYHRIPYAKLCCMLDTGDIFTKLPRVKGS